jgi:UPF0755 protein
VDIAPGTGTTGIAHQLEKAGVIRSAFAFEALKYFENLRDPRAASLKAGEYRFDHPVDLLGVYRKIVKGDVYTVALTVPEGFNIFDIAQAIDSARLGKRDQFLKAAFDHTELVKQWSPGAKSLEGFLFPDTYRFSRHVTPPQILVAMVRRFSQEMIALNVPPERVSRVVTMASLVEKEVHIDSERPVVASVFENRLAAGMPLQTDPTVVYASLLRGTWTGVIHQSELKSDSEYNTYTHAGLPPGPICNPGAAALKAALHPAQTNYLYFVANAQGATRFASSLGEHEANVAAYRAANRP